MLLDVAMGEPNPGMFWYKTNCDAFPGADQNRIPGKLLEFFLAITFQYSEEDPVEVHWVKPRTAIFKYDFPGYT